MFVVVIVVVVIWKLFSLFILLVDVYCTPAYSLIYKIIKGVERLFETNRRWTGQRVLNARSTWKMK